MTVAPDSLLGYELTVLAAVVLGGKRFPIVTAAAKIIRALDTPE